ncbi:MAG: Ig-like domain-containing protein [Malikia sp.]|nr:Ig-like domain-containing protein [Malikia sp.]MDD2727839.1 Ig-like domain-containing protein [Malikia sp.]
MPSAPSIPDLSTASDTGSSSSDNLTRNATPTFTGTAEANSTVTLYDTDGGTVLGTATADGSGNWNIIASPALSEGAHTLTVKATDAAGNVSAASSSLSVTIDTTAPSTSAAPDLAAVSDTGSSSSDNLTRHATPTFTGTAEVGSTVQLYDTDGGTVLGTATADGSGNWNIIASPALSEGAHTLTVKATDAAGGVSSASPGLAVTIDTLAPTLAISSSVAALKAGETASITFTFSEDPGGSFGWDGSSGDLVVSGGTLGAISGTGLTRTAIFTPMPNHEGVASITVASGSYTDAAGNGGGAGGTPSITLDTLAPTLAISSSVAAVKAGETATVTFTFSEDPGGSFGWDGSSGDLVVSGGTLGAISGTGLTRTATFTPMPNHEGAASITVASGAYTDAAGNGGGAGGTPSISIDTLAPTLAICGSVAAVKAGETASITFTFSEDPGSSFSWDGSAGDLVVSGGTLGAISGSGLTRTATFTPMPNHEGVASITVASGAYTDAAGNGGGAGGTPSITLDTLAPTLAISSSVAALKAGEMATVTFTFSEDPGGSFSWDGSAGDLVVSGGTLGAISGTGLTRTATFTPTAGLASGAASITVASGSYTDAAGNGGGAGGTPSLSIDTLAPTLAISSSVAVVKAGETATVTFTFSEDPGGSFGRDGSAGDLVVSGGTLGAISGTGLTRTATFTPMPNHEGAASITVASGSYTDAAGNGGGAGGTPSITLDTLAPTLAISSSVAAVKAGETATVTFTFSEDPGGSFGWDGSSGDLVVSGGTLGAISGTGLTRTATFTPTAGLASGAASITVASGSYTDAAGNGGGAGGTPSLSIDTLAPTLAISSSVAVVKAGETATVTFTFSEDPGGSFGRDGSAGDLVVSGGTLGAISGTGLTRTAIFTPMPNHEGVASITVASGAYTDAAGNGGGAGGTPSITLDTLAPTLAISSSVAAVKAGETATFTFTFSEDPGGSFAIGDVTVTGGTADTLTKVDAKTYTLAVTPTAGLDAGTLSVSTNAKQVSDLAGNAGIDAAQSQTQGYDTQAPTITFSALTLSVDSGSSASDFVTQTISATLSAAPTVGDQIYGSLDGGASWTDVTARVSGTALSWTGVTLTGSGTLKLKVTDVAGNDGAVASQAYTLDATAPAQPTISSSALTQSATPTIAGTAEANARVTVAIAGATYTVPADSSGNWSVNTATATPSSGTLALNTSGSNAVSVTATDAAGNTSAAASQSLVISTVTGGSDTVSLLASSDTGSSSTDGITSDAAPIVRASLSAGNVQGDVLHLTEGTVVLASHTLTQLDIERGYVDLKSSLLTGEGQHILFATLTSGGAVNPKSAQLSLKLDTTAPAPGGVGSAMLPPTALVLSGFASVSAGDVVNVSVNGATYEVKVVGGAWSLNLNTAQPVSGVLAPWIADRSYDVTITTTDLAGNSNAYTKTQALTILDDQAKSVAITSMTRDSGDGSTDFVTNDGGAGRIVQGTVSGSLTLMESLQVTFDGGLGWQSASVSGTNWQAVDNSSHSQSWEIQARLVSLTTGSVKALDTQTVSLDTSAPPSPIAIALDANSDTLTQGGTPNDRVTAQTHPVFVVTLPEGLQLGDKLQMIAEIPRLGTTNLEVVLKEVVVDQALLDSKLWQDTVGATNFPDGQWVTVKAIARDTAGNISGAATTTIKVITDLDGIGSGIESLDGSAPLDLNGDGIADSSQGDVTTLPLSSSELAKALEGQQVSQSVYGSIVAGDANGDGIPDQPNSIQFSDVSLLPLADLINAQDQATVLGPNLGTVMDVLSFTATADSNKDSLPDESGFVDADPVRAGQQVRFTIFLGNSIVSPTKVFKMDGQGVLRDFTAASTDQDGGVLEDTNADGRVDRLILTITDNGEWDQDPTEGVVKDPVFLAAPNLAPVFAEPAVSVSMLEGQTATGVTVAATDADGDALRYRLSTQAGDDSGLFAIDASTGALSFAAPPDYLNPNGVTGTNTYQATVLADDGRGGQASVAIMVNVNARNVAPIFAVMGQALSIQEGTKTVGVFTATDANQDTLTYSLPVNQGDDAALFNIDPHSGQVTFLNAPSTAVPQDSNHDNTYTFSVVASDGALQTLQPVSVQVQATGGGSGGGLDSTPPSLLSAATSSDGTQLLLTYSEVLSANAATASAFSVSVNGNGVGVKDVIVSGTIVELTLTAAIAYGQGVQVAYADPTDRNDDNAIQDAAGNDALSMASVAVVNTVANQAGSGGGGGTAGSDDDNDNIPSQMESLAPSLHGGLGDGNGDGIADSLQAAVSSVEVRNTPVISQHPDAPAVFVTLVADSHAGLVNEGSSAHITSFAQTDAPANLPSVVKMPLGLFEFSVQTQAGSTESFSLFVDENLNVNGYWKQDASGTWVNLASAKYGGQMVQEGERVRLDFSLTDGGEFDGDGQANGVIADPGAAGYVDVGVLGWSPVNSAGILGWTPEAVGLVGWSPVNDANWF